MNIFNELRASIHRVVHSVFPNVDEALLSRITVEPPRDASHGDMATNAAMILSKAVGKPPRTVAEALLDGFKKLPIITKVEIAGPGFINLTLKPEAFKSVLAHALQTGPEKFGDGTIGRGHKVNVEYVSANPTGPLTVGHARGAIFGDAVANLMAKAGYAVQKEYYTNDAGKQVEVLTDSVILRIREAAGENIGEIPQGCYPGEYLKDVAKAYLEKHKTWDDRKTVRDFAIEYLMNEIKIDLGELGVRHDIFISEAAILASGAVEKAMQQLTSLGLIYEGVLEAPKGKTPEDWEPREQTLFKSTDFGDDVDRPMKKSDGSTTYFANDIAHYYHMHKMGFDTLINVVGADHGGYVKRAKAAVKAITQGRATLDLPLVSIVTVTDNGQPVKMSKRAGTFITLRDMLDRVGAGVMRFIMLTREAGQTLEFDYAKVTEQSKDNPYFYVQYAHARCCSVLKHAREMFGDISDASLAKTDLSPLERPEEMALIKLISTWPRVVEQAALAEEPHRVAYFTQDVAAAFHGWWNRGRDDATLRFLIEGNKPLSMARIALVRGVALTIASSLNVIGVKPLDELRSDVEMEAA
ncbi:MAG: arginine--tRNA ligase [Proteobacteria bacterium]|nr:arginine--tRNA ligase [Pseudomonadota bacterium]